MPEKQSKEDFAAKISWEGGTLGAIEYGLKADDYDLPDDMRAEWQELSELGKKFSDLSEQFMEKYEIESAF